jgi:hypothetical protein
MFRPEATKLGATASHLPSDCPKFDWIKRTYSSVHNGNFPKKSCPNQIQPQSVQHEF